MSKRKPTTDGLEWLSLSMASFNGSGYADKTSAEDYYESYLYYKAWKKDKKGVELAKRYRVEAIYIASKLCDARESGHTPSDKKHAEFLAFKNRAGLLV